MRKICIMPLVFCASLFGASRDFVDIERNCDDDKISVNVELEQHGHSAISHGCKSILRAAFDGDVEALTKCIELKANIEQTQNRNYTPLLLALKKGHLAAVQLLLQHGANVDAKTSYGLDVFNVATREGTFQKNAFLLLLQAGANYEAKEEFIEEVIGEDLEAYMNRYLQTLIADKNPNLQTVMTAAAIYWINHGDQEKALTILEDQRHQRILEKTKWGSHFRGVAREIAFSKLSL